MGTYPAEFHSHYLTVTGFLAGAGFTVLVLLIEFSARFVFAEWLITATAVVTLFFVLASIARIQMAGKLQVGPKYENLVAIYTTIGFFGLLSVVTAIVFTFSVTGGIAVLIIEAIAIAILVKRL